MDEHEIKQLNDYAMTKWVNEMQIRNSAAQYGTETVVVRLFNTYGPGEYYSPYRLGELPLPLLRARRACRGRCSAATRGPRRTWPTPCARWPTSPTTSSPARPTTSAASHMHTIEELSDLILKVTGARPGLVEYRDSEILTTQVKRVDISQVGARPRPQQHLRPRGRHAADGGLDAARLRAEVETVGTSDLRP